MGNIVTVEANAILTSSVTGSSYTAAHTPVNLALITTAVASTNTVAGSEVANGGGSTYTRITTAGSWGSASGGTITNSVAAISFLNMPSCTIGGIELWDSATRAPSDFVTTTSSANISSATAAFTSADVGQSITGSGVPGGTTIASVTDATHAVMSAAITGSGATSVTLTIATPVRRWFGTLSATKTVNLGDTVTFATSSISITLS
jgi:hypothetical protein